MRIPNTIRAARFVLALLAAMALTGSMQATAQKPRVTDLFAFAEKTGVSPVAVIEASDGCLYGTTASGGEKGLAGTVFQITPSGTLTTLYSFTGGSDGGSPAGSLIQARDGKLYGTTSQGGANGLGTVFRITTAGRLTTLHSFNGSDGNYPDAGLVQASNGSLYGVTVAGGASGVGTVFKITTGGALTTLYSFTGNGDGAGPYSALIQAGDGSLYGTTQNGGANGYGTVFKITTGGTLTTLYSFTGSSDGAYPSASLVQASDGSLYGTTQNGSQNLGDGTVFKITTTGALTTLYSFSGSSDGAYPCSALIQTGDGSLYGTTGAGGANSLGTVFRMTTGGALTTLYSFTNGSDGADPLTGLIQTRDGSLSGITVNGGDGGYGTVFKITTTGTLTTLCSFGSTDGANPYAGLIQASDASLYGTTGWGGTSGLGTVFKITTTGALTTLYSFSPGDAFGRNPDGAVPKANLIQARDGSLYGVTVSGGASGVGTVFKITTTGTLTTLYSFSGGSDGAKPSAVIQASDGSLYGTTSNGGTNGNGTVFKITTSGVLTTLYSFSGINLPKSH